MALVDNNNCISVPNVNYNVCHIYHIMHTVALVTIHFCLSESKKFKLLKRRCMYLQWEGVGGWRNIYIPVKRDMEEMLV